MSAKPLSSTQEVAAAVDGVLEGYVVKWFLIAEVIGVDGKRMLHSYYQPGQASWDSAGLLTQALEQTKRKMG